MKKNKKAFSLIELLLVIFLLVILAAMIVPKLSNSSYKADLIACAGNLKKMGKAFHTYTVEYNGYAPYNVYAGDANPYNRTEGGDWLFSYETLYKLGEYMDDQDHKKFYDGTWETVRCPSNESELYRTGTDVTETDVTYKAIWHNRQAPETWHNVLSQVPNSHRTQSTTQCSPGSPGFPSQIVDYQYNNALGGAYWPLSSTLASGSYYAATPTYHKLSEVLRFPSEAVIFTDIQYANVLFDPDIKNEPGNNKFIYGYLGSIDGNQWPDPRPMRTNEFVHEGRGTNTLFVDGHVEFLEGTEAFNGSIARAIYDDLMSWGVSHPIRFPDEALTSKQIPGIHGFRRKKDLTSLGSWCIEHEYNQGKKPPDVICYGAGV